MKNCVEKKKDSIMLTRSKNPIDYILKIMMTIMILLLIQISNGIITKPINNLWDITYTQEMDQYGVVLYLTNPWSFRSPRSWTYQSMENKRVQWRKDIVENQQACQRKQCKCSNTGKSLHEYLFQQTNCLIQAITLGCVLTQPDCNEGPYRCIFEPITECQADTGSEVLVIQGLDCTGAMDALEQQYRVQSTTLTRAEALMFLSRPTSILKRYLVSMATSMEMMNLEHHVASTSLDIQKAFSWINISRADANSRVFWTLMQYSLQISSPEKVLVNRGIKEFIEFPGVQMMSTGFLEDSKFKPGELAFLETIIMSCSSFIVGQLLSWSGRLLYEYHSIFANTPTFLDRLDQKYSACPPKQQIQWQTMNISATEQQSRKENLMLEPKDSFMEKYNMINKKLFG